jgi:outer membrane protein OmpA-like peptidoglycan-associated protein
MRSIVSGRSMAELAIGDSQPFEVVELFLIRRGSGLPIHHWMRADRGIADEAGSARPAATGEAGAGYKNGAAARMPKPGDNRDALLSGFLAAITAFAEEAFDADRESLRTIDSEDHRIYIRGSPSHLLAAKCEGAAPAGMADLFDDELIRVLGEHQRIEHEMPGDASAGRREAALGRAMEGLADRLEAGASARRRELSQRHAMRTFRILFLLIALPILAYAAWSTWQSWITRDLQQRADRVVGGVPALSGYPVRVHVERGAGRMWVTGLVPDETSRRLVITRLKELAPTVVLTPELTVLPRSDVDAKLGQEGLRRALDRSKAKLATLAGDLGGAKARFSEAEDRALLEAALQAAQTTERALDKVEPAAVGEVQSRGLADAFEVLRGTADRLSSLAGVETPPATPAPRDAIEAADAIGLVADRIGSLVTALEQKRRIAPLTSQLETVREALTERTSEVEQRATARVADLEKRYAERLAELERRLREMAPAPPTPRQQLAEFVAANAVFFANDTDFRNPSATAAVLDEAARLIAAAGERVRVVGYTDEVGNVVRNSPLSLARAERVRNELIQRGVRPELLVAIGRATGITIANGTGPESANRRVELEIGFRGEIEGQR